MSQFGVYDAILGSGLTLRQVVDGGWTTTIEESIALHSGGIDPQQIYQGDAEQAATFQTADLVGVLGGIDPASGLLVSTGITVPFRKKASGGTFAGTSSHFASSCSNGLVICSELSASKEQESGDSPGAVATVMAHAISSSGADPITASTGNSLASQTFNGQFVMGPVVIDSTAVTDVLSVSVSTGITLDKWRPGKGDYPTRIYIASRRPVISIELEDLDSFVSSGGFSLGAFAISSGVDAYFKKRADGGGYASGSVHGKASIGAGVGFAEQINGGTTGHASGRVRLVGKAMTWSVNNALPS